jgi:hypothetical protein
MRSASSICRTSICETEQPRRVEQALYQRSVVSILSFTLSPEQVRDLVTWAGELRDEAERCVAAEAWRAGVVLLGSAVEAGILATLCSLEPELRDGGWWPSKDPTRWTLGDLVHVARNAGVLPHELAAPQSDVFATLEGSIGDAALFLGRVRNMLIHPGAYSREPVRPDTAEPEHMRPTYAILSGISDQVFDHLGRSLKVVANADQAQP